MIFKPELLQRLQINRYSVRYVYASDALLKAPTTCLNQDLSLRTTRPILNLLFLRFIILSDSSLIFYNLNLGLFTLFLETFISPLWGNIRQSYCVTPLLSVETVNITLRCNCTEPIARASGL